MLNKIKAIFYILTNIGEIIRKTLMESKVSRLAYYKEWEDVKYLLIKHELLAIKFPESFFMYYIDAKASLIFENFQEAEKKFLETNNKLNEITIFNDDECKYIQKIIDIKLSDCETKTKNHDLTIEEKNNYVLKKI